MIRLDDNLLLFIEPEHTVELPGVEDELTAKMKRLFERARVCESWMGFHRCRCGCHSTASNYMLPGGLITNSLCVHYLEFHRSEVPESELAKLRAIAE